MLNLVTLSLPDACRDESVNTGNGMASGCLNWQACSDSLTLFRALLVQDSVQLARQGPVFKACRPACLAKMLSNPVLACLAGTLCL